jgi:hypothetical protein
MEALKDSRQFDSPLKVFLFGGAEGIAAAGRKRTERTIRWSPVCSDRCILA